MAPWVSVWFKRAGNVFILLGIVLLLVGIAKRSVSERSSVQELKGTNLKLPYYNATKICDDAFDEDLDYSQKNVRHFEVKLREGCFGGFVQLPRNWNTWYTQPAGDQTGYWIAYWLPNEFKGRGPFFANSNTSLGTVGSMRVQGHGTIRFYTNQSYANPQGAETSKSAEPLKQRTLSRLSISNTDSHLCDKPEDAYYARLGLYFHADESAGGVGNPPVFLFDALHEDDTVNWANGFKGTVPVCFIVDEQGNQADIRFPQPPDTELQEQIKRRVSGWHYKPGYLTKYADSSQKRVRTQLAYDFTFQ